MHYCHTSIDVLSRWNSCPSNASIPCNPGLSSFWSSSTINSISFSASLKFLHFCNLEWMQFTKGFSRFICYATVSFSFIGLFYLYWYFDTYKFSSLVNSKVENFCFSLSNWVILMSIKKSSMKAANMRTKILLFFLTTILMVLCLTWSL